jgi:hypothetical protein
VADADGEHAAEAIKITIARVVPDIHPFAAHERERFLIIGGDCWEEKFLLLANRLGLACA